MEYERNTTQIAIALFADNEHGLVVSAISMEQTDGDGQLLCVTVCKKGAIAVRNAPPNQMTGVTPETSGESLGSTGTLSTARRPSTHF